MNFISLLPFPVFGVDPAGIICTSNEALERELGIRGSLVGQSLATIVDERSRADAARAIRGEIPSGLTVRLCFTGTESPRARTFIVVQDEHIRWLIGQPVELDEQREALASAQQRAEAQTDEYARVSQELLAANEQLAQRAQAVIEASQAKARFLATMSHELRTPLNAVLGYAGLLRDGVYGAVSPPQARAVKSIVRRSRDLQLLIDDVLDLSKIESGRAELRIDEFDPSAVLAEVKDAVTGLASEKHLHVSMRTRTKRRVRLDRGKYKQVILNLASNAVKFTPEEGDVELSVEEDGDAIVTRVRDTGIGIAREQLPLIFENFQQLDSGTTRRFQGIGLGLAIVKRTAELLGGTVQVESEPGSGTTFSLRFPIGKESEALVGEAGQTPEDLVLSNDPVILAIDDDPEVIALLRDSLAPAHFRVVGALNGDRGIELARILRPFAITLDIMMPEKDGWQVLREIKADAELCHIPVVVMSIVSERSLGFSLGVTDYLVKPVDRHVLIDVLERLRARTMTHSALVVDDDYDARTLLADLLRSLGLRVRSCDSAASCIDCLTRESFDLLFLDVTMPEEDVTRLLDVVSNDPRHRALRTVVVTRSDVQADQQWIRRAAAEVQYEGHDRPEPLLEDLRSALATLGTPIMAE